LELARVISLKLFMDSVVGTAGYLYSTILVGHFKDNERKHKITATWLFWPKHADDIVHQITLKWGSKATVKIPSEKEKEAMPY
jgi:hypothetical protein